MGEYSIIIATTWTVLEIIGNWLLFRKAGKKGWHSIIPILNLYDEYDICWKGYKGIVCLIMVYLLSAFAGADDVVLVVIAAVAGIWYLSLTFRQSIKLARAFGKGTGYGIFLFIFDRLGRIVLGLGRAEYVGKPL